MQHTHTDRNAMPTTKNRGAADLVDGDHLWIDALPHIHCHDLDERSIAGRASHPRRSVQINFLRDIPVWLEATAYLRAHIVFQSGATARG